MQHRVQLKYSQKQEVQLNLKMIPPPKYMESDMINKIFLIYHKESHLYTTFYQN